jgi:uncharacterized membrane protein YkvA (DUF1232 family)
LGGYSHREFRREFAKIKNIWNMWKYLEVKSMKFSLESIYTWYHNLLQNPKYRWWVIIGTVVYLISPLDIAPDFIPIIGQVDDVLLLTLLISEVSGLVIGGWQSRKDKVNNNSGDTDNQEATAMENTIDVEGISVK